MDSPQDNDESMKSDWSNWCGSPRFSTQDLADLNAKLLPTYDDKPLDAFPTRVFQLLAQTPGKELIVSFPPSSNDLPPPMHPTTLHADATMPLSQKLASLVHAADISGGDGSKKDARTNCTRRFRAVRPIAVPFSENEEQDVKPVLVDVESLFIPYGEFPVPCNQQSLDRGKCACRSFRFCTHYTFQFLSIFMTSLHVNHRTDRFLHFPLFSCIFIIILCMVPHEIDFTLALSLSVTDAPHTRLTTLFHLAALKTRLRCGISSIHLHLPPRT